MNANKKEIIVKHCCNVVPDDVYSVCKEQNNAGAYIICIYRDDLVYTIVDFESEATRDAQYNDLDEKGMFALAKEVTKLQLRQFVNTFNTIKFNKETEKYEIGG